MAARIRSVSVCKTLHSVCSGSATSSSRSYASSATGPTSSQTLQPDKANRSQQHQNGKVEDKLATRDLFISVLGATTTKRDAKSYLSQYTPEQAGTKQSKKKKPQEILVPFKSDHVALIKIRSLETQSDETVAGLVRTISQLNRLGLRCIVVLDCQSSGSPPNPTTRKTALGQADRLVQALEGLISTKAVRLDDLFSYSPVTTPSTASIPLHGPVSVQYPLLLLRPLKRGVIPIISSIAFTSSTQHVIDVPADEIVLALTRELAGLRASTQDSSSLATLQTSRLPFTLDRLILLDPAGALPSTKRADGAHVFLNLDQEFDDVRTELETDNPADAAQHIRNLTLLRNTLGLLPASSSALLTLPDAVATPARNTRNANALGVATRSPRNPLIFNLLTDKPAISSSLPTARMPTSSTSPDAPTPRNTLTFAKRGMPLTMIPDPRNGPWTPPSPTDPGMGALDAHPAIDLTRLVALVDDSFGRPLDVPAYLSRVRGRVAGVIVAGAYEGGAILTWEMPPSAPHDSSRMVPYLDKFAVLRRAQGAGGVADVVFSAMVRSCFPGGVVWRSRSDNPVNKWYFERSVGTWRLGGGWTMFWTVPGLAEDVEKFKDAVEVCSTIKPTWADGKARLD